jgi:hypothetical protein
VQWKLFGTLQPFFDKRWIPCHLAKLLICTTSHGSPWKYDTYVPVMFAGNDLKPASVDRPVTPYDISVTLSARLKMKPPSAAIGEPLEEVFE